MNQTAIDQAAYAAMKSTMGEIFPSVVETFLDYIPAQITSLETAIQQSDYEAIFNYAHAIKSSSSSIGALGLAGTAEKIELLGRGGTSEGTQEHYQVLLQQFSEASDFLKSDNAA